MISGYFISPIRSSKGIRVKAERRMGITTGRG